MQLFGEKPARNTGAIELNNKTERWAATQMRHTTAADMLSLVSEESVKLRGDTERATCGEGSFGFERSTWPPRTRSHTSKSSETGACRRFRSQSRTKS